MTFTEDHAEKLGQLADRLDALLYTEKLPISVADKTLAHTKIIREIRDGIAVVVREATGSDPWEDNPMEG